MIRPSFQDLGLSALIGTLVALSPLTTLHLWPSAIAGAIVGGAFLLVRTRANRGLAYEFDAGLGTGVQARAPQSALSAWLCLVLFGVVFASTLQWMYRHWTGSIWVNAHGIFVPFLMMYLAYASLRLDPSREPEASPWGFALLLPGLALLVIDLTLRSRIFAAIGFVVCLPGLSLLFLGARRTREIALPFILGAFMVPIPYTAATHQFLRHATAVTVEPLLRALGVPVIRNGTLVELPDALFVVSDACSGFSTLYAAIALAIVLAWYAESTPRRAALLGLVAPLALAANVVRVLLMILITHAFGEAVLDTPLLEASGVATFTGVIFALWAIAYAGSRRPRLA